MSESVEGRHPAKWGIRALALFLVVGGIAGVVIVLLAEVGENGPSHLPFLGLAMFMFGCSVWVGTELWQGKPRSYKWAQIVFIAQIPTISFPGFSYQFFLGLMLGFSFSRDAATKLNLEFELGSRFNFHILTEIDNLIIGVNLIAIAALIYLTKEIRNGKPGTGTCEKIAQTAVL